MESKYKGLVAIGGPSCILYEAAFGNVGDEPLGLVDDKESHDGLTAYANVLMVKGTLDAAVALPDGLYDPEKLQAFAAALVDLLGAHRAKVTFGPMLSPEAIKTLGGLH